MASPSTDALEEIGAGANVKKRRFDRRDWGYLADFVIDEYNRRKGDRSEKEAVWDEVDRQIAMDPDVSFKTMPDGSVDLGKAWMAEMELPLQSQTLEVLVADARKIMFPDSGPWFKAHAELTDDYLLSVDFKKLIHGDDMGVPTKINQDNANKIVEGFLNNCFRQYDFPTRIDRINAESFKYGMGVGRARMEERTLILDEEMGSFKMRQRLPVLHPVSIRNVYLDDPLPSMHSAQVLSPAHIAAEFMTLDNVQLAANKGSTDPHDADGGWMPAAVAGLVEDDTGSITVLEMEGDVVVPRKSTRSFVLHNAVVTVALGGQDANGNVTKSVIRFRWRKDPFSSYLLFPYHYEGAQVTYPTSPLMKGVPVQMMCTDALNRIMDSAALKNAPPVGYSSDNTNFANTGGPMIFPGAQWATVDGVKVYQEIGGDPGALSQVLQLGLKMYYDLTGTNPARLGAQSVSHTTAYAKNAEMQSGAARTVDYCNQSGVGPMTRWLDMAYQMARNDLKPSDKSVFYIPSYGGYVAITKKQLPTNVIFEWEGSGGVSDEAQEMQMKMNSLQMALKMDQLAVATGKAPTVDIVAAIQEVLREGGWTSLDEITQLQPVPVPQLAAPVNPGAQTVALQSLPGGGLPQ